jgi:hypothetical protein
MPEKLQCLSGLSLNCVLTFSTFKQCSAPAVGPTPTQQKSQCNEKCIEKLTKGSVFIGCHVTCGKNFLFQNDSNHMHGGELVMKAHSYTESQVTVSPALENMGGPILKSGSMMVSPSDRVRLRGRFPFYQSKGPKPFFDFDFVTSENKPMKIPGSERDTNPQP